MKYTNKKDNKVVVCIAPHPDDETLGCGGTLLKHIQNGDSVHWVIFTRMFESNKFSHEDILSRSDEIKKVATLYQFKEIHQLDFPSTRLDTIPSHKLIESISCIFKEITPDTLYLPYRGDIHSDHERVFDAVVASSKSFRYPYIKSIYAYETLSETDFLIKPEDGGFKPNLYVNIEGFLDKKIEIMKCYKNEIGNFPFPRSEDAIVALSKIRGVQSGCTAAEAFMIMKEIR